MKRKLFYLSIISFVLFGLFGNIALFSQTGGFGQVRKIDPKTGRPYSYQNQKPTNWLTNDSSPLYTIPNPKETAATKQLSNRIIPQIHDVTKPILPHVAPSTPAIPTSVTVDKPVTVDQSTAVNPQPITVNQVAPPIASQPQASEPPVSDQQLPSPNQQSQTSDSKPQTSEQQPLISENQPSAVPPKNETPDSSAADSSSNVTSESQNSVPVVSASDDDSESIVKNQSSDQNNETEKIAETVPVLNETSVSNSVSNADNNLVQTGESTDVAADESKENIVSVESLEESISAAASEIPSAPISDPRENNPVVADQSDVSATLSNTDLHQTAPLTADEDSTVHTLRWVMNDWQKSVQTMKKIQDARLESSSPQNYRVARLQTETNDNAINRNEFLSQTPNTIPDLNSSAAIKTPISFSNDSASSQTFDFSQQNLSPTSSLPNSTEGAANVNYGSMIDVSEISLQPNDILIGDGSVKIPIGEDCEAILSSNTQGLLTHIGIETLDAEGKPVFDEQGKPQFVPLKRGMKVSKGQILARQKDDELIAKRQVADYQLVVAKMEAEKILEIEVADAAALVAKSAYYRAKAANDEMAGSVSPEEMTEKAFEWKRAEKTAEKSRYDIEVKKHEVNVAKAQLLAADSLIEDKKLICPIDGIIDDIYQNEGQWLREGDKVLKIIRLDKVQIQGRIDASRYTPEMIDGKNVTIYVKKPGMSLQTLEGKITYVRQFIEFSSYFFYCEVENKINEQGYWLLNPETCVIVVIHQ